ncbi:MAG: hypothetical protein QNJ74_00320 [Trichodesmium sp. MO_231.B1]|nr:hypothetical protein [Trichodesmium sp. MO_231.B1]
MFYRYFYATKPLTINNGFVALKKGNRVKITVRATANLHQRRYE